jgi:hypothetical protein
LIDKSVAGFGATEPHKLQFAFNLSAGLQDVKKHTVLLSERCTRSEDHRSPLLSGYFLITAEPLPIFNDVMNALTISASMQLPLLKSSRILLIPERSVKS